MTISQRTLIYKFDTSKIYLKKIFFLNFINAAPINVLKHFGNV